MSIRVIEVPSGVDSTGLEPTELRRYKVVGTADTNTANSYALAATPSLVSTNYGILYRQDLRSRKIAYNQFDIEVPYGRKKQVNGQWTFDFDTTGGTIHITQAKEEVSRYPSASAPDQQGAIAVDGDEVKGTDIVIPAMKINVSFRHPLGFVTIARAKILADITGTTNSDSFLTFAPGEVLFLGARGSDGSEAEATINYQFAMGKNLTNQTIGSVTGIAKKAWEVAWIRYEDDVTAAGGDDYPTRVAKHVYVDRVYEEVAMASVLGFGGV